MITDLELTKRSYETILFQSSVNTSPTCHRVRSSELHHVRSDRVRRPRVEKMRRSWKLTWESDRHQEKKNTERKKSCFSVVSIRFDKPSLASSHLLDKTLLKTQSSQPNTQEKYPLSIACPACMSSFPFCFLIFPLLFPFPLSHFSLSSFSISIFISPSCASTAGDASVVRLCACFHHLLRCSVCFAMFWHLDLGFLDGLGFFVEILGCFLRLFFTSRVWTWD